MVSCGFERSAILLKTLIHAWLFHDSLMLRDIDCQQLKGPPIFMSNFSPGILTPTEVGVWSLLASHLHCDTAHQRGVVARKPSTVLPMSSSSRLPVPSPTSSLRGTPAAVKPPGSHSSVTRQQSISYNESYKSGWMEKQQSHLHFMLGMNLLNGRKVYSALQAS